jgi:UPF0042 nucleotide-binding protein
MEQQKTPLLLVTGMSGAGMSSALKVLEDIGYDIIDNLPFRLFGSLLKDPTFMTKPLAIGVDTRNRDFAVRDILDQFSALSQQPELAPALVFLECDNDRLIERFKANRRKHPLAVNVAIREGIEQERKSLSGLKEKADLVIDTTYLSVKELKNLLTGYFRLHEREMMISVLSFSYRRGIPREADMVFDVRFLRNPYYDIALRPLDGRDIKIADFISEDKSLEIFMTHLKDMLLHLIDRFEEEGKSYLTLAFGCTGGRHRSVYVSEELVNWLSVMNRKVLHTHRDVHFEGS